MKDKRLALEKQERISIYGGVGIDLAKIIKEGGTPGPYDPSPEIEDQLIPVK